MRFFTMLFLLFLIPTVNSKAQDQPMILDKVVGVVGKSQIQYSDIEEQYLQHLAQGGPKSEALRCEIFEDILAQKLMVTQAHVDSLEVSEAEVEMELDQRLSYFIQQIGTEEKLVEYFGKSVLEIKEDMRDDIRDQLYMQRMQREIVSGITVTPSEVRKFYYDIPKDSLPYIDAEVEVNQITIYPKSNEEAIFEVRERLLKIRQRIINGENFATLAVLYSEGPSAPRGGDIGWASKGDLDPAYVKAAYSLKKGQVSKIIESSFGFHLIQLMDKTEDRIKTRHILMKPKVSLEEKQNAINRLDSIVKYIRLDSVTFEQVAMLSSHDEKTRMNGGLRVNPKTGNTKFQLDDFDTKEYYVIRNLAVGQISEPFETTDEKGKMVYKVLRVKNKTEPHRANLKQDFTMLKNMTTQKKQSEVVDKWVKEKLKTTYVRLEPPYNNCEFRIKGWKK